MLSPFPPNHQDEGEVYAFGRESSSLIGCEEADKGRTQGSKSAGGTFIAVPSQTSCLYVNKLDVDGKRVVDVAASVYSNFLITGECNLSLSSAVRLPTSQLHTF